MGPAYRRFTRGNSVTHHTGQVHFDENSISGRGWINLWLHALDLIPSDSRFAAVFGRYGFS